METRFDPGLKAELTLDDDQRVRQIVHTEYFATEAATPAKAARDYLADVGKTLDIAMPQLEHVNQQVSYLDPREQPIEYRLADVKQSFDSSTLVYYQDLLDCLDIGGGHRVRNVCVKKVSVDIELDDCDDC